MKVSDIRKNLIPPGVESVTLSSGGKSVTLKRDEDGTDPEAPIRKPNVPLILNAPERRIYRAAIGMAKAAGERAMTDLKSLGLSSKDVEPTVDAAVILADLVSNAEIDESGIVDVKITQHEAAVSRVGLFLWMEKVDKIDESAMKLALDTSADRQSEIARAISDKIAEQMQFDFKAPAA